MTLPVRNEAKFAALATIVLAAVLCAGVAGHRYLRAGESARFAAADQTHAIVTLADLKWAPFIPGAQIAIVSGDPSAAGPFVIRIKSAAGTEIPAHWHPTDENVTVLVGTFEVGMGDKFDSAKLTPMQPGDFVRMPATVHHFGKARTDSIVQVHAIGPFQVNFVNPADDPRPKQ
jgi:quercetin dioxygenase-like cupin family protein